MTKEALIQELIRDGYLKSPLLTEALNAIDRKDFVPRELENRAYDNKALPIGFGQTISQPLTVAFMLELLDPRPDEKVLDVGVGSGWQTSLLAYMVSKNPSSTDQEVIHAKVFGLEIVPELKAIAEENIEKYGFIGRGIVEVLLGDATQGVPPEMLSPGKFNKIIAAASSPKGIPLAWKKQLEVGGRIVAPIGKSIFTFDKHADDVFIKKEYAGFVFVPLIKSK
ncbi:MAG: protein-L-isoaspartate O-methyltransferase [Patescibacteria group bacterium]